MPAHEKENAPLQQATLNFAAAASSADGKNNAAPKGKKRTLTVANSFEINLNDRSIPATKEVVEALRRRIIELEDLLEGQSSAKRPKLSKTSEDESQAGPSASAGTKAYKPKDAKVNTKKIDAIIKKIWSSLQKEVKTEKYKFRGGPPKTCRIEEVIEKDEFLIIFHSGVGTPSSENKPGSAVCKVDFTAEDVEKLFGKHYKELKGNRYSVGGWGARFAKGQKIGLVALRVLGLQVSYSMNTMKCGMKFEVEEANPYRLGLDDEFDMPRGEYWLF